MSTFEVGRSGDGDDQPSLLGGRDLISTELQGLVVTHGADKCAGTPCCVHNPSDHHMREWPISFDIRLAYAANRVCEHAREHPDPDSLAFFNSRPGVSTELITMMALHRCDGCCLPDTIPNN